MPQPVDELSERTAIGPISLDEVVAGQIAVTPDGLSEHHYVELLTSILDGIQVEAGSEVRRAVVAAGLERIHDHMSPLEVSRMRLLLADRLAGHAFGIVRAFVESSAIATRPVFVQRRVYVRIMMPEDVVAPDRQYLAHSLGQMVPHDPHRDSWFVEGTNTVNLWIAMARVLPDNGLLIYPEVHGRPLRRSAASLPGYGSVEVRVERTEAIGRPRTFCLEPRAAIVFKGDHLHSSAVNSTDETRFVLSVRFSHGPPRYAADGIGWQPYHSLRLVDHRLGFVAPARSLLTTTFARYARKRIMSQAGKPLARGSRP